MSQTVFVLVVRGEPAAVPGPFPWVPLVTQRWLSPAHVWAGILRGCVPPPSAPGQHMRLPTFLRIASEAGLAVAAVDLPGLEPHDLLVGTGVWLHPKLRAYPPGLHRDLQAFLQQHGASAAKPGGLPALVLAWLAQRGPWDLVVVHTDASLPPPHGDLAAVWASMEGFAPGPRVVACPWSPLPVRAHLHVWEWFQDLSLLRLRAPRRRTQSSHHLSFWWDPPPEDLVMRLHRSKTLAYPRGNGVTLVRREPEALDRVRETLEHAKATLRHPKTGAPLGVGLTAVPRSAGSHEDGVDLILELEPGVCACQAMGVPVVTSPPDRSWYWEPGGVCGRAGLSSQGAVNLEDLAPTVLFLLGLPIPDHMPGTVAPALVSQAEASARSPVRVPSLEAPPVQALRPDLSPELEAHLRALGYMS